MSCNYADALSPYENKGILGLAEKFDSPRVFHSKVTTLVEWLRTANHVVVHTGAGISTAAGIPDFRGPNGVWTLEKKGKKPNMDISFDEAIPTTTHMALRALAAHGYIHYVVSQNIDGLHLKSGMSREKLAELHGNMFIEQCNKCRRQYIRNSASKTVGKKPNGGQCWSRCRAGILHDNVLDWEHDLPERDLEMASMHSTLADLNITLGTTLQIVPSGNLPLKNKKYGGKLVICNLQPTKHDKKANMVINAYINDILQEVCKRMEVDVSQYDPSNDPTKQKPSNCKPPLHWNISFENIKRVESQYNARLKSLSSRSHNPKIRKRKAASIPIPETEESF